MILAVGFFDGVHLGHRAILSGAEAVLTFRTHPLETLAPERAPRLIMSSEDRVAALRASGVEDVIPLDFTPDFAALSAADFVRDCLLPRGVTAVRCGANWNFGAKGAGTPDTLKAFGIAATLVPYAVYKGAPVSSTRIRAAISAGAIEDANAMLGAAWFVRGDMFAGKGLGRKLGFPTLNFRIPSFYVQPPRGVYAVRCGGAQAIANWGIAPTLGSAGWSRSVLEVHFTEGLPSAFWDERIEILRFIRPEKTFPSLDALKRQIAADVVQVRKGTQGR